MKFRKRMPGDVSGPSAGSIIDRWLPAATWVVAIVMTALVITLLIHRTPFAKAVYAASGDKVEQQTNPVQVENVLQVALPQLQITATLDSLDRSLNPYTIAPTRSRKEVVEYVVQKGDSVFGIASKFNIKPETILWANYKTLQDDPHSITIGDSLVIPPIDGVYYVWEEGDTIESIASNFKVEPIAILQWPGNKLDITNPVIEPGAEIVIPGGWREFRQWVVPTIWRANAGASRGIPGGCEVPAGGAVGSGFFSWPAANQYLSGNDYWSGHLAIDIAAGTGASVYAADSGVVVYAAPIGGGYGNMVMIDHGNTFHSLYAHLSQINVSCGQSVSQGQVIGYAGSSGNSTGPHLHFEIRQMGGFINPWYVLP